MEIDEQNEPALTAGYVPTIQWKSFNRWQCFDSQYLLLTETNRYYGKPKKIPTIIATNQKDNFRFELPIHLNYVEHNIVKQWHDLMVNEDSICVFGAKLPDHMHLMYEQFWYIQRIKTKNTTWVLDEEKYGYSN